MSQYRDLGRLHIDAAWPRVYLPVLTPLRPVDLSATMGLSVYPQVECVDLHRSEYDPALYYGYSARLDTWVKVRSDR